MDFEVQKAPVSAVDAPALRPVSDIGAAMDIFDFARPVVVFWRDYDGRRHDGGGALMLEIAGGILIAFVVLILVLANIGWIGLILSILFVLALGAGGLAVMVGLPSDYRSAVLLVAAGMAAVAAFGYWTHHDKRFLLPDNNKEEE